MYIRYISICLCRFMFGYNSCGKARVETLWRALDQALERCFGQFVFWKFWVVFLSSNILFLRKSNEDPWLPYIFAYMNGWHFLFLKNWIQPTTNNQPNRWRVHFSSICWLVGCFLIQMNPTNNQPTNNQKVFHVFTTSFLFRDRCDNSENWSHMFERGWKIDCLEVFLVGFNGGKKVAPCDHLPCLKGWRWFYLVQRVDGYVISLSLVREVKQRKLGYVFF